MKTARATEEIIEAVVDIMCPLQQGRLTYTSPTVLTIRNIIREALQKYEVVRTREASND